MNLSWRIGDVTVTRIVELETTGGTRFLLPQATPDEIRNIGWLSPHFADEAGKLKMSIHALVIDTPTLRVVVDACIGNDKTGRRVPSWNQRQGCFLDDLEGAGFTRDSVDIVLCTHLHVDHVGWNTMLENGKWVPTFPRARYLFGRVEFDFWRNHETDAQASAVLADSVQPIFDAGLADLIEANHRLCDELVLEPTPGHTPGHVSLRIRSRGEEALVTGDFLHHPCQMHHPHWSSTADTHPEQAEQTRKTMLAALVQRDVLVIGTHFAAPTAGYVVQEGATFRFEPVPADKNHAR
jgi:Zn-dependent hydrolases, including glyoxylases